MPDARPMTKGEIAAQVRKARDEADAAWIFVADLHPEVREQVQREVDVARVLLGRAFDRLAQPSEEVTA